MKWKKNGRLIMAAAARSMATQSPPALPADSDYRWIIAALCIFLAVITLAVFGQTVRYEFVNFDDHTYVYDNPTVTAGLTLNGISSAFGRGGPNNWDWVPLTTISHILDCQIYDLHAGGHHLTNVLLHVASVILLFLVLWRLTGAVWRSAFVAAVFAVHPLHVESVAWVTERKDVLSGLFFMLTLWAYVRYVRKPGSLLRYLLVVLLFALGLMSKPMLVTLPFVLLLLDFWPLNRFSPSPPAGVEPAHGLNNLSVLARLMVEKIPLLLLSMASCILTVLAMRHQIQSLEKFPFPQRIGNALVSCVIYVKQTFYPARLAAFYPYPPDALPLWKIIAAVVLLAAISLGVFLWWRKRPYLLVGWFWYLGMLAPVAGLVQAGDQAHADRFTYLPQIGLCLMLAWMGADLSAGWRNRRLVLSSLAALILIVLVFLARLQASYWKSSESLWTHTLAVASNNAVAQNSLGQALLQKGLVDRAILLFQKALEIQPDYADAHYNLGISFLQKGQEDDAILQFQKALAIRPGFAQAHCNLGMSLLQKGQVDQAILVFQQTLAVQPGFVEAQRYLAGIAWRLATSPNPSLRNGTKAIALAQQTDQLAGGSNPMMAGILAAAYAEAGRFDQAVAAAQRALELATRQGNATMIGAIETQLKCYQAGSPFRDTGASP